MTTIPILVYRGDRVGLGPITRDALPLVQDWWNDPAIMVPLSGQVWPSTEKDVADWFEKYGQRGDGSAAHFLVYAAGQDHPADIREPIGVVALSGISYRGQTAWASWFIGARLYWGSGCATEAVRLLARYAFDVLGLNNLTVAIHADNPVSLRVAQKVGYRPIGVQRQACRKGGQYVDAVLLDLIAEDWRQSR